MQMTDYVSMPAPVSWTVGDCRAYASYCDAEEALDVMHVPQRRAVEGRLQERLRVPHWMRPMFAGDGCGELVERPVVCARDPQRHSVVIAALVRGGVVPMPTGAEVALATWSSTDWECYNAFCCALERVVFEEGADRVVVIYSRILESAMPEWMQEMACLMQEMTDKTDGRALFENAVLSEYVADRM